jgi:hypothetical protein
VSLFHGVKKFEKRLLIEKKLNRKYSILFHKSKTENIALP